MSQFGQVTLAFCDIARGRETLTIFECKCAIVRLTGTELPVRKIGRLLQNECDWKRTDPGVNLAQFSTLFCLVADTLSPVTESDHYEVFDSRNKGWIDHRDACRVCNQYRKSNCSSFTGDIGFIDTVLFIRFL